MKLSDRMTRAETLGDPRLLAVSRGARLLAVALEAAAENTGSVRDDIAEIRRTVGWFVSEDDGSLASAAQIELWIEELVIAKWLIEYESSGTAALYCKGFGERQRGNNVCVGVTAADTIAAHLPLPPCASLVQNAVTRRALPVHCGSDYRRCPCGRPGLVTRRGPARDPSLNREEIELETEGETQDQSSVVGDGDVSFDLPVFGSADAPSEEVRAHRRATIEANRRSLELDKAARHSA